MIGAKAQILMLNQINGPNQEPCPDEEKQCCSNLPGDQQGAETRARASCGSGAALVLQVRIDVRAGGRESWREATQHRRDQGNRQSKDKNVAVEADGHGADVFVEGHISSNEIDAPIGQQKAEAAAKKGDYQAFGQQLARNPPTTGAERYTYGQFFPASRRTSEEKAGHIRAGNHQDKTDGGHHEGQAAADAEIVGEKIRQSAHGGAPALLRFGEVL